METISDSVNFDEYLKGPDESAKIKPASDWAQEVIDRIYTENPVTRGRSLPWKKSGGMFRVRPGEVTLWNGMNGHGKSMLQGQVLLNLMAQGEKACIASMEMAPAATMERMARQAAGSETPRPKYIRELSSWTNGKLWIYDQHGTVKTERLISVMRYCHEVLGITQFTIDSLMKCGMNEDDYNGQKHFVDQICAHAKDTQMHVHLITHSRKGKDEFSAPGKMDVKGTGAITDQVDNVFTVWRNKKKEKDVQGGDGSLNESPDAMLICDKQRHFPWEGNIALWFDAKSFQFLENPYDRPETMVFDDVGGISNETMVDL